MFRHRQLLSILMVWVVVLAPLDALTIAPLPPPPIGWEERIAPGFDPPIEYALAYEGYTDEIIAGWGPACIPVLAELYADPGWAKYKDAIRAIVNHFDTDAVRPFYETAIESLLALADPSREQTYELRTLFVNLESRDPLAATAILTERLADPQCPYRSVFVDILTNWVVRDGEQPYRSILSSLTSDERARLAEGVARMKEMRAPADRANEPMRFVLDKESRKGSTHE